MVTVPVSTGGRRRRVTAAAALTIRVRVHADGEFSLTSVPGPGNPGIVDLEVAVLDVRPQPILNAVQVEIANPTGDGFRILLDLGLDVRSGVAAGRLGDEVAAADPMTNGEERPDDDR